MSNQKDWANSSDAEREQADREAREVPHPSLEVLDREAPRVGSFIKDALALMRNRAEGKAKPIATPWAKVNEAIGGGFWPGLHVLTGGTAEGKSQFALQLTLDAAEQGTPVLYIGLELGREDLVARLLGLMMHRQWSDIYLGKDRDALRMATDSYAAKLEVLPIRLEVRGAFGWHADLMRERVQALREAHPEPAGPGSLPILVVLDYLQVIGTTENAPRELRERIGQAAYTGRSLATNHGAAVLLLSSVSRENIKMLSERREKGHLGDDKQMHPSELVGLGKESGEIEYSADTVLALCRGEFRTTYTETHLVVAKVRAGKTSWQRLDFNGGRFTEPGQSGERIPFVDSKRGR